MTYNSNNLKTKNELLMVNLMDFYEKGAHGLNTKNDNFIKMMKVVNGESKISLRIIDWFVPNYAKKNFIIYAVPPSEHTNSIPRYKVYNDYKLKLKAYSKKIFDPFCRWDRVTIPYEQKYIETTIGQLNFFKWAIENKIIEYIEENYSTIENDMNLHNSTSKKRTTIETTQEGKNTKTRKKREELSISAVKCVRKENVKITVIFS
jgi:hypothetical protein